MNYNISRTSGWIDDAPQTGDISMGPAKLVAFLAISLAPGVSVPVVAYEHTGYEIPVSTHETSNPEGGRHDSTSINQAFDIANVTDRLKSVFGLSISKQAQILGVSRQAVYNWRNGEEPAGKNLEALMDLNSAAELFETEGVQVTGLLMKRPFSQGKSLLDLMEAQTPIYQPAQKLVNQIKREAEEKSRLTQRFGNRQLPKIDYGLDLE